MRVEKFTSLASSSALWTDLKPLITSMNSSFRVNCSRCRPRQARLMKKCYHSCASVAILTKFESHQGFNASPIFGCDKSLTTDKFSRVGTKFALITLMNLSKIYDLCEKRILTIFQKRKHSDFRWRNAKPLKTISGMILNRLKPKFAKWWQLKRDFWKPCRGLYWLYDFLSYLPLKTVTLCVTDQPWLDRSKFSLF